LADELVLTPILEWNLRQGRHCKDLFVVYVYSHADLYGIEIFPCTLLMTTICPLRLSTIEGRMAGQDKKNPNNIYLNYI